MTSRMRFLATALLAAACAAMPVGAQTASLVADLATSGGAIVDSNPEQFTAVPGGRFVFTATEPSTGEELWGSDGTPAGTRLLTEGLPGPIGSGIAILGTWSGAALFTTYAETPTSLGDSQIWRTDGTPEGTVPLRGTGDPGDPGGGAVPLRVSRDFTTLRSAGYLDSAVFGGFLHFEACSKMKCGIWRTDGTQAGTQLAVPMNGSRLAATDRFLFFTVQRSDFDLAYLWRTDGTAAGTVRLATFSDAIPRAIVAVGNKVFFAAYADTGEELLGERRHARRHPASDQLRPLVAVRRLRCRAGVAFPCGGWSRLCGQRRPARQRDLAERRHTGRHPPAHRLRRPGSFPG